MESCKMNNNKITTNANNIIRFYKNTRKISSSHRPLTPDTTSSDEWRYSLLRGINIRHPRELNRQFNESTRQSMKWVSGSNMKLRPTIHQEFSKLVSLSSRSQSIETNTTLTNLVAWLFVRDDQIDNKMEVMSSSASAIQVYNQRQEKILNGALPQQLPIEIGLYNYMSELKKSGQSTHHTAISLKKYFQSNTWEVNHRIKKLHPPIEQYLEFREHTSATQPFIESRLILDGVSLSDDVRNDILFRRLSRLCGFIVGIGNDLFSIGKEMDTDHGENLILVDMKHNKIAPHIALQNTVDRINMWWDEFDDLKDQFLRNTPGHTPACMVHVIEDAAFSGDTLFMPDGGTARADFPGGDARTLFRSIKKVLNLSSPFIEKAIYESCKIKKKIVEKDEKEEGLRKILNRFDIELCL